MLGVTALGNFEYIEKDAEVPSILSEAESKKYISLDTENSGGLDPLRPEVKLLLLQLEIGGRAYVIDVRKVDVRLFETLLTNRKWIKIIQNATYDYKLLKHFYGIPVRGLFDTKTAESLLQAGLSKGGNSLENLALRYLDIKMKKDTVMTFAEHPYDAPFTEEQLRYAADDVLVLPTIHSQQQRYLNQYGLNPIAQLEFTLIEPVAEMELAGVKIDSDMWKRSLDNTKKKLFMVSNDLRQILPDPTAPEPKPPRLRKDGTPFANTAKVKPPPVLNLDSWQQLVWSFKCIGVDLEEVNKKTRKGPTNNATIKFAQTIYRNEPAKVKTLKNLQVYRALNQVKKTFGDNLLEHIRDDGRIHARFHANGTDSGRFSCVPLNSEILTRNGWQSYDTLVLGQDVVGYNILTGKLEWTVLDNIFVGDDIVGDFSWRRNKGHDQRAKGCHYIKCTPNHRWVANLSGIDGFIKSCDIPSNRNHKAKFSLWASGAFGRCNEPIKAGIIGWTVTDGHVLKLQHGYSLSIRVSKPTSIKYLEELLKDVPHTEHTYYVGRRAHYRYARDFYIGKEYFTPIYTGLLNVGLSKYALSLDRESAEEMYNSMLEADGSPRKNGTPFGNERDDVIDAFSILTTLLGKSFTYNKDSNNFTRCSVNTSLCGESNIRYTPTNDLVKVWCPTTRLGTWVMRQNGKVVITGNSTDPNLQNIQKKGEEGKILRSCFVPAEGCKYIIADYSQIELRIVAELSKDPIMMAILADPKGDIHRGTASQMYKVPYDKVSGDLRRAAKTLNFGIIYGMMVKTLSERLGCSSDEAAGHLKRYTDTYNVMMSWLEDKGNKAYESHCTRTIGGRIRWFPTLDPSKFETRREFNNMVDYYKRVGRNHPVQGTSADMTKTAIVLLHYPLLRLGGKVVNTIHDELCIEVPNNNAVEVAKLLKDKMILAGQRYLKRVPVLVDVKIRDCWYKDDFDAAKLGIQDDEEGQQLWLIPNKWGLDEIGEGEGEDDDSE